MWRVPDPPARRGRVLGRHRTGGTFYDRPDAATTQRHLDRDTFHVRPRIDEVGVRES
jgi:hypothetical protein